LVIALLAYQQILAELLTEQSLKAQVGKWVDVFRHNICMMYVVNALLRLRGQKYDLFLKNANLRAKKINMMENIGGNKAIGLVFYSCFDRT